MAMAVKTSIAITAAMLASCWSAQAVADEAPTPRETAISAPVAAESQYVYLATVSHLLDGATPQFRAALAAVSETALSKKDAARDMSALEKQLNDPIMLQADPASIVAIGRDLIEAGTENQAALTEALQTMRQASPQLDNEELNLAIMENGVRFRAALIQALYATDLRQLSMQHQAAIEAYGSATYDLRSEMEVRQFDLALGVMTDDAIDLQRSAFAALQRGMIDELDPYSFEEDGKRAKQMSEQGRTAVAGEMRNMYMQLLLLAAIMLN